jgi:hypothetical protein
LHRCTSAGFSLAIYASRDKDKAGIGAMECWSNGVMGTKEKMKDGKSRIAVGAKRRENYNSKSKSGPADENPKWFG